MMMKNILEAMLYLKFQKSEKLFWTMKKVVYICL